MAAPALKSCPVCRGTNSLCDEDGQFIHRLCVDCLFATRIFPDQAGADAEWNRLSDLAAARTRAAARAALEEVIAHVRQMASVYDADIMLHVIDHASAQIARLDAAPSAQPEGDADA